MFDCLWPKSLLSLFCFEHNHFFTFQSVEGDLIAFGRRTATEVNRLGREVDNHLPTLSHVDPWGQLKDTIHVSDSWKALGDIAAQEGLIGAGYETSARDTLGPAARLIQYAKLYMFAGSASVYQCYLAMTDGAAKLTEDLDPAAEGVAKLKKDRVLARLASRDVSDYATSGQWMTERPGGSDVGNTETVAVKQPDGSYVLTGYKYFTSAITSQMAFTLARVVDERTGKGKRGSRGLSLFYLPMPSTAGATDTVHVVRLKSKLGTQALPTAELSLNKVPAWRIGEEGAGVKNISALFNVTRIHNAVSAVAFMRRTLALARDYAHRRTAFGAPISTAPAHLRTLAILDLQLRGCLHLVADVALHLGSAETLRDTQPGRAGHSELLLRILTPLVKLYTAKESISATSEALECFGGAGYMEDTGIPKYLRDAQVLSIWEGTTNILALDTLRAASAKGVFAAFERAVKFNLSLGAADDRSSKVMQAVGVALASAKNHLKRAGENRVLAQATAREWAYSLTRLYIASLLVSHAAWSTSDLDWAIAGRWVAVHTPLFSVHADLEDIALDRTLALDLDPATGEPRGCGDHEIGTRLPRPRF